MIATTEHTELDVRKKLAHIDQMLQVIKWMLAVNLTLNIILLLFLT